MTWINNYIPPSFYERYYISTPSTQWWICCVSNRGPSSDEVRRHAFHADVIKWKHFARYWPFVRGIHRSPVNSPHKGQWRWALVFSLICTRINGWVYNREAGELRHHGAHYDVTAMYPPLLGDLCVETLFVRSVPPTPSYTLLYCLHITFTGADSPLRVMAKRKKNQNQTFYRNQYNL